MLPENRALLIAGTLYWVGLAVLVIGVSAAISLRNDMLGIAGVVATVALWVIGFGLSVRSKDRYGKVRAGIDRGA